MSNPGWRATATPLGGSGRMPGAGWIIGTSCWLIPVLFFGGNGAWLGFLIVGAMLLRPTWLVAAGVYAIWAIVAATLPDEGARILVTGTLQFVSIVHGMIANRRLLVTIWGRLERNEQWWGRGAPRATPDPGTVRLRSGRRVARQVPADVPREAEALLAEPGTDRADYFADPAPAPTRRSGRSLPPPRGARRSGPPPADAAPAAAAAVPATLDVNSATEDDFKALPGFSGKRARATVEARTARGGRFASVQEFADDAGLQPHQLVAIRDRVRITRARRTSFGRRVDL